MTNLLRFATLIISMVDMNSAPAIAGLCATGLGQFAIHLLGR